MQAFEPYSALAHELPSEILNKGRKHTEKGTQRKTVEGKKKDAGFVLESAPRNLPNKI